MTERILNPAERVRIAVVGKYTDLHDAYKSVAEALLHGGIPHDVGVTIDWISSDRFTDQKTAAEILSGLRRPADSRRIRRARDRRDDRGDPLRPRERAAVLRYLPRPPDRDHRVRPERLRHDRNQQHRVRAGVRLAGDRPDGLAEECHRHGRHDAAGRLPGAAPGRLQGGPGLRRRARSASGTATAGK